MKAADSTAAEPTVTIIFMLSNELDYELPEPLIAQHPTGRRTDSRLLVVNKATQEWQDRVFGDLPEILRRDDTLVLNNTRVVPAKFFLRRSSGGRIEGLWLNTDSAGDWMVLLRGAARLKEQETLTFENQTDAYEVTVIERGERGVFKLRVTPASEPETVLREVGQAPLPHYIKREKQGQADSDSQRYQTVYASRAGAVAAPTAGLHFDHALLDRLRATGVQVAELTLHVGLGTFSPIEADDLNDHVMHRERYVVEEDAWDSIIRARQAGRRIVAVGTTSARVLETVARNDLLSGETDLFIFAPYDFAIVDALITNFHLPRSTLLAMIHAFGGRELMKRAYAHAIEERYRFYSYGDAMLIE